jgi:hypothetical protein
VIRRWSAWICAAVLLVGGVARYGWETEIDVPPARQAAAERLQDHLRRKPPRDDWSIDRVTAGPDGLRVRVRMPMVQTASLMGGPPNYRKDRLAIACPSPDVVKDLDLAGPVTIEGRSPHQGFVANVDCSGPFGPR